jgi:hypothetical protein
MVCVDNPKIVNQLLFWLLFCWVLVKYFQVDGNRRKVMCKTMMVSDYSSQGTR